MPEFERIRDFIPTDTRHVRTLVGQDILRARARANSQVYFYPVVLWAWLVASLLILHLSGSTPTLRDPRTWSRAIAPFAISLVPIGLYVDLAHRREFGRILQQTLGSPDLTNIVSHYLEPTTASAGAGADAGVASGPGVVQVLQQDRQLTAFVAIDRARSSSVDSGSDRAATAIIRHLVIDIGNSTSPYRRAKGVELVSRALDKVFATPSGAKSTTKSVDKVAVLADPFALEGERFYHELGFEPATDVEVEMAQLREPERIGLLKMRGKWLVLGKEEWRVKRRSLDKGK